MEEELEHIGVVKDDCNGFPWKRIGYVCETDLAVLPIGAKVYGPDVVEALRTQIAELTRTNLEQAAQIEAYLTVLERIAKLGNEPHYGNSLGNEIARKALSITPSQALADFAAKVRKQCAVICDGLQHQRNKYIKEDGAEGKPFVPRDCAEAIRNLKELP